MNDYKLAFIGTYGHAYYVLDELDDFPRAKCVAIAAESDNDDIAAWQKGSPHLAGCKLYDDWRQMLGKEKPDIAVIGGRYAFNGQVAIEAVKQGCHVVCEKPVASSIEQLGELKKALKENDSKLTAMFGMRCEPAFVTIKRIVEKGIIGEPVLISAQKSYKFGDSRPEWYGDLEQYGGTILWVAVHAIDFARYCAGIDYTWVAASSMKKFNRGLDDLDTCGTIQLGLSNGGSAVMSYDYFRPMTAKVHGDDRLRIVGSEGVVETIDCGSKVKLITKDQAEHEVELEGKGSFFASFINAIEGTGAAAVSEEDAFTVTKVCLQAQRSAQTGQIIKLD